MLLVTADQDLPSRWTAATVYDDMWVDPYDDPREVETPPVGERETLVHYLDAYRLTLRMKCDGLTAEQLARRSVPPSTLSLLGLVRHLAEAERGWTRRVMRGEEAHRHGGIRIATPTSREPPATQMWSTAPLPPGRSRWMRRTRSSRQPRILGRSQRARLPDQSHCARSSSTSSRSTRATVVTPTYFASA